jgi:hypothetical protein
MHPLMANFRDWMDALRKAVWQNMEAVSAGWDCGARARQAYPQVTLGMVMANRIGRMQRRFIALFDMWRAGTLSRPRVRSPARGLPAQGDTEVTAAGEATQGRGRPEPIRIPRGKLWLRKRVDAVRMPGAYLFGLVEHPESGELRRFLAEVPRAAAILRSAMWITIGELPTALRLPKRKRKPRPRETYPEIVLSPEAIRAGARIYPGGWVDWPRVSPWGTPRSIDMRKLVRRRRSD